VTGLVCSLAVAAAVLGVVGRGGEEGVCVCVCVVCRIFFSFEKYFIKQEEGEEAKRHKKRRR